MTSPKNCGKQLTQQFQELALRTLTLSVQSITHRLLIGAKGYSFDIRTTKDDRVPRNVPSHCHTLVKLLWYALTINAGSIASRAQTRGNTALDWNVSIIKDDTPSLSHRCPEVGKNCAEVPPSIAMDPR
ncbi:hypothetical protein TNCV_704991 [Trichonephila clavipes]|nr:hypothetical protein TNCV_704991 [Trichonephila clavipes]